jgi:hypothetical protein
MCFQYNSRQDILTLALLTWKIWWAPTNAINWQMGFNSAFKVLKRGLFVNHIFDSKFPNHHTRSTVDTLTHNSVIGADVKNFIRKSHQSITWGNTYCVATVSFKHPLQEGTKHLNTQTHNYKHLLIKTFRCVLEMSCIKNIIQILQYCLLYVLINELNWFTNICNKICYNISKLSQCVIENGHALSLVDGCDTYICEGSHKNDIKNYYMYTQLHTHTHTHAHTHTHTHTWKL